MKHGTKPTVRQAKLLQAWKLKPEIWLVERETPEELVIVHRFANATRIIRKNGADDEEE